MNLTVSSFVSSAAVAGAVENFLIIGFDEDARDCFVVLELETDDNSVVRAECNLCEEIL